MARCGSYMSNGSGDYVIAFSTVRRSETAAENNKPLPNEKISPLFLAVVEATEEAIYNSMLMATDTRGRDGRRVEAISPGNVRRILQQYNLLDLGQRLPTVK